ncbi:MAG: ABC transporter substrate-binding protein [Candidatus Paceibacterota bacterium]
MAGLSDMTTFQLVLMGVFGGAAVLAIGIFAMGGLGDDSKATVKLSLWGTLDEDVAQNWIETALPEGSNIGVDYKEIRSDDFDQKLLRAVATDSGPDMVLISKDQIAEHQDIIRSIPFEKFPEREFRDSFVQAGEVFMNKEEKKYYGLPVLVDPLVMYWNRFQVREAGYTRPPRQWANFGDFVTDVVDKELNKIERAAVALGEYENIEHSKAILSTLIYQAGGKIISGDLGYQNAELGRDFGHSITPAISSLLFYTDFSDKDRSVYTWNREMPSSFRSFTDEDLTVYFGLTSDFAKIRDANPYLDFDVSVVPENDEGEVFSYSEVSGLSMLRSSSNPAACFSAMQALTSPNALEKLSDDLQGVPPSRNDILASPPQEPFHIPVFYEAAKRSLSWIDPAPENTANILKDMVLNVVDKEREAEESVSRAASRLRSMLKNL